MTEDGSAQFVKTSQIPEKIMFGIMLSPNIFQTRFPTIVHLYNVGRCFTHFKQSRNIKVVNTSSDEKYSNDEGSGEIHSVLYISAMRRLLTVPANFVPDYLY